MSATRKRAAKKPAAKTTAKTITAAARTGAKKAASASSSARKRGVAKKPAAKKPLAKKPVAKKPVTKKPAAEKRAIGTKARTTKAVAPRTKAKRRSSVRARPAGPRSLGEFMAQAWAMEIEAAQRYAEFADAMETHNNLEVAAMFRTMAGYEGKHAEQILIEMGWSSPPEPPPGGYRWEGFEAPETVPIDEVHYLMQPWHALQLALACEEQAARFFAALAEVATEDSVRNAARELEAEEREHVALVRAWLDKVPKPDNDWAHDPDPPRYTD